MNEPSTLARDDRDYRVLVLGDTTADGGSIVRCLREAGIDCVVCPDVDTFSTEFRRGAAAGVICDAEMAMGAEFRARLSADIADQPTWADFPLVALAHRRDSVDESHFLYRPLDELGNVAVLDAPAHAETVVSAVRASLRARKRQYQARDLLAQLQEGVRERDHFLATLSHELRNPLGAIKHAMQVVKGATPPSVERPLTIVDRQVTHLARLIDDLLDVSRVTAGKMVLKRQALDLRDMVLQAAAQLKPILDERQLRVATALGHQPLWTNGDDVRLEQVFMNLLGNAIRYTPLQGSITLSGGVDGDHVWVTVADTGIGLSPEQLGSIFDLFAQVDDSLDRTQGGMGVGLTLVRGVLALHDGGTITAASDGLGKGSQLTVRLLGCPAVGASGPPEASPSSSTTVPTVAVGGAGGPRVLLVEDNADNRDLLRELLEMEGFQVAVAADGAEGVERALELEPEIGIVDIGLPILDGYEVARRLRARFGDALLLVALTGYGRPEDRRRCTDAGFDAQLTKPVEFETLQAVLSAAPRRRRTLRQQLVTRSVQASSS